MPSGSRQAGVLDTPFAQDASGSFGDVRNDPFDDVANRAEDARRWLLEGGIGIAERYERGDVEIVLYLSAGPGSEKFDFVISRMPNRRGLFDPDCATNDPGVRNKNRRSGGYRNQDSVRLLVSEFVHCPNGMVPPLFVGFERHKQRFYFRRNVLHSGLIDLPLHVNGRLPDREFSPAPSSGDIVAPEGDSAGVNGVIEGVPRVGHCVVSDTRHFHGDSGVKLELVDALSSVRVHVDDARVWIEKLADAPFEILDVIACMSEDVGGAVEGVGQHGAPGQ